MKNDADKMNPWDTEKVNDKNLLGDGLTFGFEDNFTADISNRLPDSKEYLERLENKLHKLKTNPTLVQQLREKREDCMRQLLTGSENFNCDDNLLLDEPINQETPTQQIIRSIYPERQALTTGELVNIINHDYLEKDLEEQNTNEK